MRWAQLPGTWSPPLYNRQWPLSCHSPQSLFVGHQGLSGSGAREKSKSRGPATLTEVEVFANDSPLTERALSLHPLRPLRPLPLAPTCAHCTHPAPHSLTALTPGWLQASRSRHPVPA